ncbi:hypothetical protein [uncultured Aquimarina sp.]|uniref:hypothetical protein n=1 Tax=uncultured Aquimarina sp. TaxID=575652 RepID=UPI00262D2674|nr:hypothetical protein [uncultured Aquimarina sp.]
MKELNKYRFYILAFVMPILYLSIVYYQVFSNPNSYLFSNIGDGIKNYYTYAYHIKNDSGFIEFEGMNYPFGEHLIYTDGQLFLSNLIKVISIPIPEIANYSIGILNILVLLSYGIGSLFLFLFLRKLQISKWYASICAFAIIILAPQLFRIPWHQALSYVCIIPISLYLFTWFYEKRNLRSSCTILFFNCSCIFIHPYWGFILGSFYGILWFLLSIQERKRLLSKPISYVHFTFQTLLPIIIFVGILFSSDTHVNRVSSPEFFYDFTASFNNTFATPYFPLGKLYDWLFHIDKAHQTLHWEGRSYLGIFTIILLLVAISIYIAKLLRKQTISKYNPIMVLFVGTGSLLFVIATTLPFRVFPILIDWFPLIKQFRAFGRLTWVSYFVFTIFSVYFLYRIANKLKYKNIILIALPIMMITESLVPHIANTKYVKNSFNIFNKGCLEREKPELAQAIAYIDSKNYQAIIPIPYFHVGSETFGRPKFSYAYVADPFTISYHTRLPLTGVFMSRTSISETRESLILFSKIKQEKAILKKMDTTSPLLVVHMKNQPIPNDERWIIEKSNEVFSNDEIVLYEIKVSDLKTTKSVAASSNIRPIYSNSYENLPSTLTYKGTGALKLPHYGINELLRYDQVSLKKKSEYTLQFWFENSGNRCQAKLKLGILDNEIIEYQETFINTPNTYKINGNWSLYEIKLKQEILSRPFVIYFEGHDRKQHIYIDELSIIPN